MNTYFNICHLALSDVTHGTGTISQKQRTEETFNFLTRFTVYIYLTINEHEPEPKTDKYGQPSIEVAAFVLAVGELPKDLIVADISAAEDSAAFVADSLLVAVVDILVVETAVAEGESTAADVVVVAVFLGMAATDLLKGQVR